jgi:glycosyltransferase involved in cell wall biosynthesis
MPTRNRIEGLRQALASVDRQTFRDFDVWIVDDGSTDGTAEYLLEGPLREEYPGIPSLNVRVNDRPAGAAAARNRALAGVRGELIAFLDDDDVWLPDYLERQVATLDSHPDASASFAGHTEVDPGGRTSRPDVRPLFRYDSPLLHLLTENYIHTLSVFVCRREMIDRTGPMDDRLGIVHDIDWYARLLLNGGSIIPVSGSPLVRRGVPGGLVTRHREWFEEEQRLLGRVFGTSRVSARRQGHLRAHRALLFARLGIRRRDYSFSVRRLFEAFRMAPVRCIRIIFLRLTRNLLPRASRADLSEHDRRSWKP